MQGKSGKNSPNLADFLRHLIHGDAFVAGDMALLRIVLPRGED